LALLKIFFSIENCLPGSKWNADQKDKNTEALFYIAAAFRLAVCGFVWRNAPCTGNERNNGANKDKINQSLFHNTKVACEIRFDPTNV
jgi:hypothetical protein